MIRSAIVEDIGNDYVVVEPPAGMLKLIQNRVEEVKNLESRFVMLDYSTVFILACLQTKQDTIGLYTPVVSSIAASLGIGPYYTIRDAFTNATSGEFIAIISEFQFTYPRDVIEEVFNKIDELCFITKKKVDDEKKD